MEFITVEQFREQPREVQKVFLDWWKPSNGDIYLDAYMNNNVIECCHHIKFMNNEDVNYMKEDGDAIPLFTEGQLRKFIEDKGYKIVKIELINGKYDIYTEYKTVDNYSDIWLCDELGESLLQAYWKVACIIAEEVN